MGYYNLLEAVQFYYATTKGTGRFTASIRINGKRKHLGLFDCPNEAYKSYKAAKEAYVRVSAIEWKGLIDEKVFNALIVWKLSE